MVQLVLKYHVDLFSRKDIFWDTLYLTKPKCEGNSTGGVGKCLQRQRLPRLWLSRQVKYYNDKIAAFTFFLLQSFWWPVSKNQLQGDCEKPLLEDLVAGLVQSMYLQCLRVHLLSRFFCAEYCHEYCHDSSVQNITSHFSNSSLLPWRTLACSACLSLGFLTFSLLVLGSFSSLLGLLASIGPKDRSMLRPLKSWFLTTSPPSCFNLASLTCSWDLKVSEKIEDNPLAKRLSLESLHIQDTLFHLSEKFNQSCPLILLQKLFYVRSNLCPKDMWRYDINTVLQLPQRILYLFRKSWLFLSRYRIWRITWRRQGRSPTPRWIGKIPGRGRWTWSWGNVYVFLQIGRVCW